MLTISVCAYLKMKRTRIFQLNVEPPPQSPTMTYEFSFFISKLEYHVASQVLKRTTGDICCIRWLRTGNEVCHCFNNQSTTTRLRIIPLVGYGSPKMKSVIKRIRGASGICWMQSITRVLWVPLAKLTRQILSPICSGVGTFSAEMAIGHQFQGLSRLKCPKIL